jgi:Leucine-rich repeat (LRR) protein
MPSEYDPHVAAQEAIARWVDAGNPNIVLDLSLMSLFDVPSLPPNVRRLDISSNNIRTILMSDLPDSLVELTCKYSDLRVIEMLPPNLEKLDCTWNRLVSLPDLPKTLRNLYCAHNDLRTLPQPPPGSNLKTLFCGSNRLISLPNLDTIEELSADFNCICVFPKCGSSTTSIGLSSNCIGLLPDILPPALLSLFITRNNIESISNVRFPPGFEVLSISENPLLELPPDLPDSIITLKCDQTKLTSLPDTLPSNLITLDCAFNRISELPDSMLERCPILVSLWCSGTCLLLHKSQITAARTFVRELIQLQRLQAKQRITGRTKLYKEELMEVVWHPNRLMRFWFSKGLDFEDVLFCYD